MDNQKQEEEVFRQQLLLLVAEAKKQGMTLNSEQVSGAFPDMELDDAKLALIYEYLKNSGISVGDDMDDRDILTQEDRNYLELYKQELEMLPAYTDAEKERIYIEAFGGSVSAKEKLLHLFLPQVVQISRLYSGQGVPTEDLIGEGNVALAMAMEMFDCIERPDEIEGFLSKLVMDAMEKSIGEELALSGEDEKLKDRVNRIADAARQLAEDLRRPVSVAELAMETEFTQDEIREVLAVTENHIKEIKDASVRDA